MILVERIIHIHIFDVYIRLFILFPFIIHSFFLSILVYNSFFGISLLFSIIKKEQPKTRVIYVFHLDWNWKVIHLEHSQQQIRGPTHAPSACVLKGDSKVEVLFRFLKKRNISSRRRAICRRRHCYPSMSSSGLSSSSSSPWTSSSLSHRSTRSDI